MTHLPCPVFASRRPRGWRRHVPGGAGRAARSLALLLALAVPAWMPSTAALAQPSGPSMAATVDDAALLDAREAFRRKDRARLAAIRAQLLAANHPLAQWADYWDLNLRLPEATQDDLEAFYARWPGTYVEDRLRNDWLLELGRRRDWRNFATDLPRFRMNDDRDVTCYALGLRLQAGEDLREAARSAWLAQAKDGDDACQLLAAQMVGARQLTPADIWQRVRQAAEANRPRAARQALALLNDSEALAALPEALDQPLRYLARRPEAGRATGGAQQRELGLLALQRLAATDPAAAASLASERWDGILDAEARAVMWGVIARQSAMKLQPEAQAWFVRATEAARALPARQRQAAFSDDTLAWRVRAALRSSDAPRWQQVLDAIDAMSPTEQREATWVYWKARALQQTATKGSEGDAQRAAATALLAGIAGQLNFYGTLAAEDLGRPQTLPAAPAPLTAQERLRAEQHGGLTRALQLIGIGLRSEGVREWNYALRDLQSDRELLAAAQRACDREIWDRCINTSERTQQQIDLNQRFPMPFRQDVVAAASEVGLDPAYVYGLIRQESRFVTAARSSVGASGLMQVMPATAKWVARKLGMNYSGDQITDRSTNLKLGTGYLKLVLDDFGGSQALAAAAYNAGPGRPRRWREGATLEVAAWAENVPFNETRDYVKKVLSNASLYHALINRTPVVSLKSRLGTPIGPRAPDAPQEVRDLP